MANGDDHWSVIRSVEGKINDIAIKQGRIDEQIKQLFKKNKEIVMDTDKILNKIAERDSKLTKWLLGILAGVMIPVIVSILRSIS